MPTGNWIVTIDVNDAARYDTYRAANAKSFKDYGARFLVRGGPQEVRDGAWRSRPDLLEFFSLADAQACYESGDCQKAKAIRLPVADSDMVIVEGYDP